MFSSYPHFTGIGYPKFRNVLLCRQSTQADPYTLRVAPAISVHHSHFGYLHLLRISLRIPVLASPTPNLFSSLRGRSQVRSSSSVQVLQLRS